MAPVAVWRSIVQDPEKRRDWVSKRGRGGFVRVGWDEAAELIAAANAYTIKEYGPDRVAGFSPIPAMSMISYAAGTRSLSLIGGTFLSFFDWYFALPPSSPHTWRSDALRLGTGCVSTCSPRWSPQLINNISKQQ